VLASASAAQAAVSFVTFGLPAIGPGLRREFGLSLPELGAVLTANLFGAGLALIAAAIAVDHVGARRATFGGTVLATLGLGIAATAHSKLLLFAALLVSGVGSAVVPVAGAGALFRVYAPDRRAFALGVRQMAVPLGGTIAALLMPGLEAIGGVGLALAVGAVAVGATGVAFAVVPEETGLPARRGSRAFQSIWRAPGMQRLLVVASLYIVVLQAVLAYTVPASRAAGLSAFAASATYFAVNVTAMGARIFWGRLADRNGGTRRSRTLTEVGAVAAVGALLFASALHGGAVVVVPAAILFGFGALGWNALVYVSAGERATAPELAAPSVAVAATVVFLLAAIATPPLGALAAHAGWDAFWATTAVLAALGAVVAARLPHTLQGERTLSSLEG
jgi:MFS family permease